MASSTQAAAPTPVSADAALVTTLAGTAMAFAHDADDEAERWLRALRLHGQVGCAMQALGVGEVPLEDGGHTGDPPRGGDAVAAAVRDAERRARARGGDVVCTADLLDALLAVYGRPLERALARRGVTPAEVAERIAAGCDEAETPAR